MTHAFDEALRARIAGRCADFPCRAPAADHAHLKPAAVAIALVADEATRDAAFLLTFRAASLRAHSNQWALPGGRCDPGESVEETALRELHEELGLRIAADHVLGRLDPYPTRSGYLITPVIAWAADAGPLSPNPDEVASVHRIPLAAVAAEDAFSFTTIPESDRRVIRFHRDGDFIHAPTAALIYQFREVMAGRATRVADLEQPVFAWR